MTRRMNPVTDTRHKGFEFSITKINGCTLIFSPVKTMHTASLGVFVRAGARHEQKHLKGIAHYLEHMLFKGSKHYSYKQIKQEIEGRGGILNGFTTQETTAYYSQFLRKNIRKTLDILLDMVTLPVLDTKEIEKERNVILEEIKMHNDLPHIRVGALIEKLLWQKHPLGEEVIGTSQTIHSIKRDDLRMFSRLTSDPARMVVLCVADCQKQTLGEVLESKLKRMPPTTCLTINQAPKSFARRSLSIESKELDQTHLCVGFRAPSYKSPSRFVVDLIHIILGANMSSRLFEEIREKKGLCYDISTQTLKYSDSGAFIIHMGLDAKNIKVALHYILNELEKITTRPVGAKELDRARDYLLGQVIMGLERPQGRMFYMADAYCALGKIYTLDEIIRRIKSVANRDIQRVSRSIFNFKNLCISCVTKDSVSSQKAIEKALSAFS